MGRRRFRFRAKILERLGAPNMMPRPAASQSSSPPARWRKSRARLESARLAAKRGDTQALARAIERLEPSSAIMARTRAQAQLQALAPSCISGARPPHASRSSRTSSCASLNIAARCPTSPRRSKPSASLSADSSRCKNPSLEPAAADTGMTFTWKSRLALQADTTKQRRLATTPAAVDGPTWQRPRPPLSDGVAAPISTTTSVLDAVHRDACRRDGFCCGRKRTAGFMRRDRRDEAAAAVPPAGGRRVAGGRRHRRRPRHRVATRGARRSCCGTTATSTLRRAARHSSASSRVRGFAWMDLDGDGVPDAALSDAAARCTSSSICAAAPSSVQPAAPPEGGAAIAAPRSTRSTRPSSVAALTSSAAVAPPRAGERRMAVDAPGRGRAAVGVAARPRCRHARLIVADLDNNGAADLLVCRSRRRRASLLAGPGRRSRAAARAPPAASRAPRTRRRRPARADRPSTPDDGRHAQSRRAAARKPITGRPCARAPRRRPAISASTRSASAAKSRCAPACTCRADHHVARSCTSASATRRAATSFASSGRTACCSRSSRSPRTPRWRPISA